MRRPTRSQREIIKLCRSPSPQLLPPAVAFAPRVAMKRSPTTRTSRRAVRTNRSSSMHKILTWSIAILINYITTRMRITTKFIWGWILKDLHRHFLPKLMITTTLKQLIWRHISIKSITQLNTIPLHPCIILLPLSTTWPSKIQQSRATAFCWPLARSC